MATKLVIGLALAVAVVAARSTKTNCGNVLDFEPHLGRKMDTFYENFKGEPDNEFWESAQGEMKKILEKHYPKEVANFIALWTFDNSHVKTMHALWTKLDKTNQLAVNEALGTNSTLEPIPLITRTVLDNLDIE